MLNLELYIEGQRVDLFADETIEFVDSIRNSREPDLIYSPFSKQFTVPASRANNIIFRHYYNVDVDNYFDARLRVDAHININGAKYRSGQVKLNSVSLKNGMPDNYSIVFYGDSSRLSAIIGEAKLSALTSLSKFDHTYSFANIKDGFELGLGLSGGSMVRATGAIPENVIYPFISHTKQYAYDSGASPAMFNIDNTSEAVDHEQLKPGLRFIDIIEGIEDQFPGVFFDKSGFFGDADFTGMYLWLHRFAGGVVGQGRSNSFFNFIDATLSSGDDTTSPDGNYFVAAGLTGGAHLDVSVVVTITGSGNYDFAARNSFGGVVYEESNNSGTQTFAFDIFPENGNDYYMPTFAIEADPTITAIDVEMTISTINAQGSTIESGVWDWPAASPVDEFSVIANMPEMRIIDFLSSIFKQFNLALSYDDGIFYVESLDDFYGAGSSIDITEFVDDKVVDISTPAVYDVISFKFHEADSFLMNKRLELVGEVFGDNSYDLGGLFNGSEYEINIDFEKILFERMENLADGSKSANMWAWCADSDGEPYVGNPICFFCDTSITLTNVEWEQDGSVSTFYARCSNTITTGSNKTLGFKAEIDEYDLGTTPGSLFSEYHENYISGLYNARSRRVELSAILPLKFLSNYSINDTIIFKGKEYFIDELSVDLTTGEARIELITKWI